MNTKEIQAFVNAYQNIMGYVDADDVKPIAEMLAAGVDEDAIYDKYFDAQSVIDAYLLWDAAKEFTKGEIKC
jgi:hypothetical protein